MRKVFLVVASPFLLGYLGYGVVHYIRKKDDMHFAALSDIVEWFLG